MSRAQRIIGFLSLLAFLAAINALVWQQDMFSLPVVAPLLVSVAGLLLWIVITIFALFTRREGEQRSFGALNAVFSSIIVLAICIVIYALCTAAGYSADLSAEGRRELAPQTIQVLQTLTEKVKITCFFLEVQDELVNIAKDKTLRFLDQCSQYTDLLDVVVLDPQLAKEQAASMNLSHASAQGTVVVQLGTKQRVITLGGGSPRLEERDFTNALINVLRSAKPKIYFLSGHEEYKPDDKQAAEGAGHFAEGLQKESYEVASLTIDAKDPVVPEDCDLLVINGPKGDIYPHEIVALEKFMLRAGRLLVMINPLRLKSGELAPTPQLLSWLQGALGVDVGVNLILVNTGEQYMANDVQMAPDREAFAKLEESPADWQGSFRAEHPITKGFGLKMLWTAVRTVSAAAKPPEGVIVQPLVRTAPEYWAETDVARYIESRGQAQADFNEQKGPLTVAVAAVKNLKTKQEGRPGDARAVIIGDGDLMTNAEFTKPANFNLIFNAVAWLNESEDLIGIRASAKADPPIILSQGQQRTIVWVSTLATLQAVIAAGLLVYFLRRKHR